MTSTTLDRPTPTAPGVPKPTGLGDRLRTAGRRLVRGRAESARWERPALLGLLALAALLYLWDLSSSGWANSFYSAAAQAGSVNWEAFFYGSSDAGNSITVDKPPASLWLMALSVRIFGLSSFSILLPEALMGVATVGVLYATLRRRFSAGTALLGGAVLALTPVAALMFRFNNPDALLVLLLSLAAYFTLRGVEDGRIRWVLWAGVMVGLGFLTKQLQVFLILPALVGVYLLASPRKLGIRLLHLLAALGALLVSAGWWVAIVELVPASMRPYIGGSQSNSFLELTFGYNGFGRLTGNEVGSVTGGGGGTGATSMWGSTGLFRLFENEIGGQITWLLPAALVLTLVGYVLLRRAPRVSAQRATLAVFVVWMLVTALAFSFMAGIFHAYYTVALAPAIAGVVAIGTSLLWSRRSSLAARIVMATLVLVSAGWAWALLERASSWMPALKVVVVILGVIGAVLLLLPSRTRLLTVLTASVALTAVLLAPTAYTIQTVTTGHSGSIVTAGPTVSGGMGGFGGGRPAGLGGQGGPGGQTGTNQLPSTGTLPQMGAGTPPTGTAVQGMPGGMGGAGGLLNSATVSSTLSAKLSSSASSFTWIAAAVGSNSAAGYQLATGFAVMPIGGFNGSDPSPTLAEFKALVAKGEIHWFIGGSIGASNGGSNAASQIAGWVAANFTATTVDNVTLYDLSATSTGS
ncbi:glycosyltransferase family 39 protein [Lysinimonas soli]|uniref:Glycosyltransferase family 39 protein n=1 Tax=Lysinimonas soli TaxID=1074233 RepID=A0ABW0NRY7_9MICO